MRQTCLTTKSSISEAQRRLIEFFQLLNFGRVEDLYIRDGEPSFDPPPRVIKKLKFGGDNSPRPETQLEDFRLKDSVVEFLHSIAGLGRAKVSIDIRYGLPVTMEVEECAE